MEGRTREIKHESEFLSTRVHWSMSYGHFEPLSLSLSPSFMNIIAVEEERQTARKSEEHNAERESH